MSVEPDVQRHDSTAAAKQLVDVCLPRPQQSRGGKCVYVGGVPCYVGRKEYTFFSRQPLSK